MSRFTPLSGYPQVLAEGDNRVPAIITAQSFNATTSDINFGVISPLAAQTGLTFCFPVGNGGGNYGFIFGQTPSASNNGPRFYLDDGGEVPSWKFGADSDGTRSRPYFTNGSNANTGKYGKWQHAAYTWDGSLNASGIQHFIGISKSLIYVPYASGVDGTGNVGYGSSDNFHIGNREGTDRTFNGHIAYVARWNRVLSLTELRFAQAWGPQAVPFGLVFYWINGRDEGPYHLQPTSRTDIGVGPTIPVAYAPLGWTD